MDAGRGFRRARHAGQDDVGLFPVFGTDAVVMRDGELDRLDAREIGGVEHMLAAGARLRLLPQHPRQGIGHRVERRHRWQSSEEHTSELQSLMRITYAVFCLKTK